MQFIFLNTLVLEGGSTQEKRFSLLEAWLQILKEAFAYLGIFFNVGIGNSATFDLFLKLMLPFQIHEQSNLAKMNSEKLIVCFLDTTRDRKQSNTQI